MAYEYIDPSRESDYYSLPDVEVFYAEAGLLTFESGETNEAGGWYYAYGCPGCLWDGEPCGPYASEAEALKSARDRAGVYDDVPGIRTAAAWWRWHDADYSRAYATMAEAETACAAWVAGDSDTGPDEA